MIGDMEYPVLDKNLLDKLQAELLEDSLPGGALGGYFAEGLPFYFVNENMLRYLGYENEGELLAKTGGELLNCIYERDRGRVITTIASQYARGKKKFSAMYRLLRHDDSTVWVLAKSSLFKSEEGSTILVAAFMDITEYKEIENQLNLYRHASGGGTFVVRLAEGLPMVYGNDIFYSMLEHTIESMKEDGNLFAKYIHPDDAERITARLVSACAEEVDIVESEPMRIITGKGTVRWMQTSGFFERIGDDEVLVNSFMVDVTERHELMETIRRNEERYKIALRDADVSVWEYDMETCALTRIKGCKRDDHFSCEVMENMPYSAIKLGMVHPESVDDYIELYRQIREGVSRSEADIRIVRPDGGDYWERIISTPVWENGRLVRSISVSEDITLQKEAEIRYQKELQFRDTLAAGFIVGSHANLSKNIVEYVQSGSATHTSVSAGMSYEEMIDIGGQRIANSEDRGRYMAAFSREALIDAFNSGESSVSMDYRRKLQDGRIAWVNVTARLVRDVIKGDIYSYSNIRDINEKKTLELALNQRAEHDPLTRAYSRDTAMRMMEDAIEQARSTGESYAMMLFSVDDFSHIIRLCGYRAADRVMRELYDLINSELGYPKITGRMFTDGMLVWIGGNPSREALTEEAGKICRNLEIALPKANMPVTVSVGGALCPDRELGVDQLLDTSINALSQCHEAGGNCCFISDGQSEQSIGPRQVNACPCSTGMGELIIHSAVSLNSGGSFERITDGIMRGLAEYYRAEGACLVEMDVTSGHICNVYGWADEKSRWHELFGRRDSLVALLRERIRCRKCEKMDAGLCPENGSLCCSGEYSEAAVRSVALELNSGMGGYLAVFAPEIRSASMLDALGTIFITHMEKRQISISHEYVKRNDELTGLENRSCYMDHVAGIMPDTIISLGMASVDINGLKQINVRHGYTYGDRIIICVADAMKKEFPGNRAFRLCGDEFVAVCENITSDAFYRRVSAFRALVEESYPGVISVGCAWSDTEINPENLMAESDEKMAIAKQLFYKNSGMSAKSYNPQAEQSVLEDLALGRYEIYLQPKMAISDSSLAGAEALVRYRDAAGKMVSPYKFIHQLEQDGIIHHIDLFVFEEVCKNLKKRQEKGSTLLPISLNFSRVTLLTENLMDLMESIHSRYMVPKNLVEIEVTESIGSVERNTLIRICARIIRCGYRLALDDFGASYSNMAILSAMELHTLKLDKSLVNDLFSNPHTRVVVKNFLLTCRELGISSVAEGVESKEQLEVLKTLGCDYAQGYYFNKPLSLSSFDLLYK